MDSGLRQNADGHPGTPAKNGAGPLQIRLFGSMQVLVDEAPVQAWYSHSVKCLLALLTLYGNRQIDRSFLAGALWPEPADASDPILRRTSAEQRAQSNLRQALHHLRQALGSQSWRLPIQGKLSLYLDLTGADVDVVAFDAAIARGDTPSLEQAAALYGGILLRDCECGADWVVSARAMRELQFAEALDRLAEDARTRCNWDSAAGYLRRLIEVDPYRESAYCALMEVTAERRDCAQVTAIYRSLRTFLRNEINSEPDRATTEFYGAQLRRCASAAPAPTPPHSTNVPHNLPRQFTSFIGREAEIETVPTLLDRTCLLTLTGPGGSGKTRLGLQIAEQIKAQYRDGVWLVDLSRIADPALVAQAVATTLGVQGQADKTPEEALTATLRSRNLLLVLDNCEHLRAACAQVVLALLRACAGVRILATSRQVLGIAGEQTFRVLPLALPTEMQALTAETLMRYEGMRLFVDRALLVKPDLVIDDAVAPVLARVCRRLDGIPLAIELAAARVRSLSVSDIDLRLEARRFLLLTSGAFDAHPRQQTLRATLDWSYELMSGREQCLLARLAVFTGGWTLEAAEQICGDGEAASEPIAAWELLDLLTSLVDKSLVSMEEHAGSTRYRLLETMREYALEKLEASGEADRIRTRHRDWFLCWAEEADWNLKGPGQRFYLEKLERDHDNLRAALAWCAHDEGEGEAALRLVNALWWFWYLRDHFREGRKHLERALENQSHEHSALRAVALLGAGVMAYACADYPAARARYEASIVLYRQCKDRKGQAFVLCFQGRLEFCFQGKLESGLEQYALAEERIHQSIALFREMKEPWGLACALCEAGFLAYLRSDYDAAQTLLEEGLAPARSLGDRWAVSIMLSYLGFVANALGDSAVAQAHFLESLEIGRQMKDKGRMMQNLEGLAIVFLAQGEPEQASRLWGVAEALAQRIGTIASIQNRKEYEAQVAKARAQLGDVAFVKAWSQGRALPWDQVAADLLQISFV
jgi:predicted ATPase/DNA-binding SARP family transcriptional activator